MKIGLRIFILYISSLLIGCSGMRMADLSAQREFTFDFNIPNKSQAQIWKNARDFFSESFVDSREVFRIMDEKEGTFIGKGIATWSLSMNRCLTEYHVRFVAKDEKARLQFELINGVPLGSPCIGWPWPSVDGYNKIIESFKTAANEMGFTLKTKSKINKLKDF